MTLESQYHFANISATKARIFIKFETVTVLSYNIYKIVQNYPLIFRKDPFTHAPTQGKNMRTHVLSRQNAHAHVFTLCVLVCARIFTKNQWIILYYLMNISLKFHKDQSFSCGYIQKIFKIHRKLRIKKTSVLFCKYLRNESSDLYEI